MKYLLTVTLAIIVIVFTLSVSAEAQTIVCDGFKTGGSGAVAAGIRDFVYRVTAGAIPADPDSIFIGTHDDNLSHYSNFYLPQGWSYTIVSSPRQDHGGPTLHGRVSPGPTGTCPFTLVFYNVTGVQLSPTTPTDFGFDYAGYGHDVDWMVSAYLSYAVANWNAAVGGGTGPVHGPRCDTLCELGQQNDYYFPAGVDDMFDPSNPEPSSPSTDLLIEMGKISAGADPNFDSNIPDRCFGHTFTGWDASCCIDSAALCLRVTPISTGCSNDNLALRDSETNPVWVQKFGYLKSFLSGNPADTFWTVGDTLLICLNLAHLPVRIPNTPDYNWINALAVLQDGDLDVIIQDDTKIDFLDLDMIVCEDCQMDAACCLPDGSCVVTTQTDCNNLGGQWLYGFTCTPNPCGRCLRPPNNMLAWWPLDEDGPATADDIAGGHTGTHIGGSIDYVPGRVEDAYGFNWSNLGIVRAPHDPFEEIGTGDFTIDAWINAQPHSGDCLGHDNDFWCLDRFIVSNEVNWKGVWFFIRENPPGVHSLKLRMFQSTSVAPIFSSGSIPLIIDNWHHVAVTVDRSTLTGTFYFDGVACGTPFTPIAGDLFVPGNTSLDIGHGDPDATGNGHYTNRYFDGLIDEVEIFDRALHPSEIQDIFNAGEQGKCKMFCHIPRMISFCPGETSKNITLTVYNGKNYAISLNWWLFGNGNWDCPPGISPTNNIIINLKYGSLPVGGHSSNSTTVTINRPSNLGVGDIGCYTVTFTDPATGWVFHCHGAIKGVASIYCPFIADPYIGPPAEIYKGNKKSIGFTIENTGDVSGVMDYEIAAVSSCACDSTDQDAILSLDGLPAGDTVTGSINIPLGDTGTVMVEVELLDYKPFNIQEIVLRSDCDDDGYLDDEMSIALHPATFPDCNQNGVDDGEDISGGASDDLNGNGIPDECELIGLTPKCGDANGDGESNIGDAVFLIAYVFKGGAAPDPLASGDSNADCDVNVGDAVYMITYVFKGGDRPICNDLCTWP